MQRPRAFSLLANRLETGRIVLYGLGVGGMVGAAGTVFAFLLDGARAWLLQAPTGFHPLGLPSERGVLQAYAGERAWLLPVVMALGIAAAAWLSGRRREEAAAPPADPRGDGVGAAIAAYPTAATAAAAPAGPADGYATGDGVDAALGAYHNGRARFSPLEV
ncbi:MAG TPA: hypothetical protein VNT60_09065, partial [Deinococcales bacterium]|nr:hypothetical protein [Deinococcales bacterium]